ncbi:MAG: CoA transferase [Alphaproteobacteria bacterium]|nr:CoA transferase [Alphaproteobacteria bacterium]
MSAANGQGLPLDRLPPPAATAPFDLLEGTTVIDLTTSIAGPYATLLLADMGADVIKVERPEGDDARAWGPPFLAGESLWFQSVNRNKRGVKLDYGRPEGRAILERLISGADVLATNQLPRVLAKLGLAPAQTVGLHERLIHVAITGFGLEGARAERPAYDLIAEGYSSVMDLTGEIDGEPQKIGTPAADLLAGMDAAFAVAASLAARARTGKGRLIDVALVDSMTRFMTPRIVPYLGSGTVPRRSGARDSVIAVYQVFHTADAPLTLGIGSDAIWRRFWQAVGEPALADDPRYRSNADRRADRPALVARIQAILSRQGRAAWLEIFAKAGVPAGPINRLDEVTADEALLARGLFYALPRQGAPSVPQVNTGIMLDGAANAPRRAPPALGADTDDVLRARAGCDDDDLARLRAAGVI